MAISKTKTTDIEPAGDTITIELKHHTVTVLREDFEDPTEQVMTLIGEQSETDNPISGLLSFPRLFGIDPTGWRSSEFSGFMKQFMEEFQKAQELDMEESSGSEE